MATIRANSHSIEEVADYLQVPFAIVEAAARYHAEFADEIDRWIEANEVMAEREEQLYRGQITHRAWGYSSSSTTAHGSPSIAARKRTT